MPGTFRDAGALHRWRGRAALTDWLELGGSGPSLEFEARSIGASRTNLTDLDDRMREYAAGGPCPERLPVIAVAIRFFVEFNAVITRWVDWAEGATSDWTGTTIAAVVEVPSDAIGPHLPSRGGGQHHV